MVVPVRALLAALFPPGALPRLTSSFSPFARLHLRSTHPRSSSARSFLSTTMFKKAVESHKASQSRSNSLKHELFPSSSPDAPRTSFAPFKAPSMKPRPLSTSSGNIGRPDAIHGTEIASSLHKPSLTPPRPPKRTYNGLAKALDNNACSFDFSVTNSQENPIVIDDESVKEPPPVYFDENDFDSDIDLDVEDPITKGVVEYPKLPEPLPEVSKPASVPSVASTLPPRHDGRQPKLDSGREKSADSTYQSASSTTSKHSEPDFVTIKPDIQAVPKEPWKAQRSPENLRLGRFDPTTRATQPANSPSRPPPSSAIPLPWSSSPSEHEYSSVSVSTKAAKAQIREFVYDGDLVQQHHEESPPKTKKRRVLPWQKEEAQERPASPPLPPPPVEPVQPPAQPKKEAKPSKPAGTRQRSIRDSVKSEVRTPLRKSTDRSTFPWNTTASAIKEQQKALKQANKKLVKSHEATPEARKEAIARKKRNNIARVFLSEEQQHVLNLVVDKQKSVFFTGSAGTGKSVLLREIIAALRKKYLREPDRVAVTASTGLAACNIGGVTLHSFSGIGLGKEPAEELVKKIKRNQKARHRWMRTKALVIDEISMVDGELFDKLEAVARTIRNNGRPFGGIQLVITGDFFQLPPVPDRGKVAKFAFDAGTWNTAIEHTIALHHVFRQKDPVFANMLNEMREGRLTPESIEAFRKLERPIHWPNQLEATELYPRREQVDQANNMRMQQLEGDLRIFEAKDGGSITDLNFRRKLLENCMAPETVALKKGCQVMLIKNYDETLVNGSLGKVIGFMSDATFDQYEENEEEFHELAKAADEDLNPVQKRMKAKLEAMAASTSQTWPLVRFTLADGTTRDMLCNREQWKVELPNGEVQASRSQVPLILAWALSIHKAQGQTLDRVKVDLGKVFEKGQAYVALSRATSMEGLQVLRFDPKKVMAHERVRNFYKGLSRAEHIVVGESTEVVSAKDKRAKEPVDFATDYERAFMEGYGYDEF